MFIVKGRSHSSDGSINSSLMTNISRADFHRGGTQLNRKLRYLMYLWNLKSGMILRRNECVLSFSYHL